ncbi:MAG: DNA mismatch repair endonuclease MutL [Oscillospiraceae bacterium]|nr:DNA mismatch repair endonuclease MutL [Oscillospiraceae bacterium]
MPEIRQLDKHVADLIAAGEVVERPASVAKELLENALDAGTSAIVAEIERGGLTYLRVTDNGCGIAPDQLPTAFLRHATSKLRTAEDLAAIGTLGFRGEALAAISAVSRVDILSRQTGSDEGAVLHLEGGAAGEVRPSGCPEGTTIVVRDLFYNTPARMKFMKKDSAEGTAVTGIVTHLALSHPEVSFKLLRDGAEVLHTPGDGQLQSAVYAALGRDFALHLLPIRGSGGEVQVNGFVTEPLHGHGTRARQIFFVNGRFVKSQLLSAALEEAYRNQIMKGKFPGCVLHISVPVRAVDVNVHPAKTVVKFAADKPVFDAVYYTVLDALNAQNRPAAPEKRESAFYQSMTAEQFRAHAHQTAPPPAKKPPVGSYTSRPAAPIVPRGQSTQVRDVAPAPGVPFAAPVVSGGREVTYHITPPAPAKKPEPEPVQQTMEPPAEAPWRIVGEVLKTYIICEDAHRTVWLIDKHAAHERIRFDALKANTEPMMSQFLLTPLTVDLDADSCAAALENLAVLEQFGFVCEDFGGGTLLVRQIPADIRLEDAAATVEELARKLALGRADPAGARDELLHTVACKSAIKAGMDTSPAEMAALVKKVQSGEIQYCPHGRPVKYRLTEYDIEKMFKRA